MELHSERDDRSLQFGRLLAVMEKVERDTYDQNETREPNAIRLMSMFCRRPMKTASMLNEHLNNAHFPRLKTPAMRAFYRSLISDIFEEIKKAPESQWNDSLGETYLMGYYLQRKKLYTKKDQNNQTEEAL